MSLWTKKTTTTIENGLKDWTDEECLQNFSKFFGRVTLTTQFLQDEDGLLTHQVLVTSCGDKMLASAPQELGWPLQPAAFPEEHKGMLN